MSKVEDFLTHEDEQEIVKAICMAEEKTSGEIRIHLEKKSDKKAYDRAVEVFHQLHMHETKEANGVLIYVAIKDKTFAICGDKGIHNKVSGDFWETTKNTIQAQFKIGNFKQGLIDGVLIAGEQLKKYFPYQKNDNNELSNEISVG